MTSVHLSNNPFGIACKPEQLSKRGGARYSEVAGNLVNAIYNDLQEVHVVNVLNNGALDFLEDNDAIEIQAVIGKDGFGYTRQNGKNVFIPHVGRVVIGERVSIGANTCVDRAKTDSTIIRSGVKLDNLIQVGHNVQIGSNTVMSAQVGIAGTTKIGSNCFVGGQVGFADHITVGNNCKIGSQSGLDKSVPDGEIRFGTPALAGVQYHRSFAVFKTLPEMSQKLRELEKRLVKVEEK